MSTPEPTQMQAIHTTAYGPPAEVLSMKTLPLPPLPPTHVRVQVKFTSTHAGDWHLIRGTPYFIRLLFGGLRQPKITTPGSDFSGVVQAIGSQVTRFKAGDEVFGDSSTCGFGAFAQYVSVAEDSVVLKPSALGFDQAACTATSAIAALQALRDHGKVKKGDCVLVNGASGGVGSFAVQMAKAMGAEVTAVCRKEKMEKVRGLGADRVVDYGEVDVTREEGVAYDVVLDCAVYRSPFDYLNVLTEQGKYIMTGGDDSKFWSMISGAAWISITRKKKAVFLSSEPNRKDLEKIAEMLADGSVVPLVDCRFQLAEIAKAIGFLEERKVCGKVAIEVPQE